MSLTSKEKYIVFYRVKETLTNKAFHYLQQLLDQETDKFLEKMEIPQGEVGSRYKQLVRNLSELMVLEEVQFPSLQQVAKEKQSELGSDLSVLLLTLIRSDECNSHSREGADKDRMRIQCMIIYRNL